MPSIEVNRVPSNLPRSAVSRQASSPVATSMGADSVRLTATYSAQASPQLAAASEAPDGRLTAEEQTFAKQGLLPANYAQLKAVLQAQGMDAAKAIARKGKKGPFSDSYGDPEAMLDAARRTAANPDLLRLFKDLRKGDVLLINQTDLRGPNSVSGLTKGPFTHALLCTADGPPPEFIESVGITGQPGASNFDCVRRCQWTDYASDKNAFRLQSPAASKKPRDAEREIARAIAYAEKQLGKPYDYSFNDRNMEQEKGYYCSNLVYQAYAQGAKAPLPLSKTAERDQAVVALKHMISGLKPDDELELMNRLALFFGDGKSHGSKEVADFVVDHIMPRCATLAGISSSPGDRRNLKATIARLMDGKGFPRFEAANRTFTEAEKQGKFGTPVLGFFKRLWHQGKTKWAFARDSQSLMAGSGLSLPETARAVSILQKHVVPHADTAASFAFGPDDSRTSAARRFLDRLDALHRLPLLGWLAPLPHRPSPEADQKFTSPTDIAWGPSPHRDYNVKPGQSLDQPKG